MFDQTTIPVLEQVVQFAQSRHSILAGNIANIDTPGYRVRDLSPERFEAALRDAIHSRDQAGSPSSLGSVSAGQRRLEEVSQDLEGMLFHDDSTGSLEHQVSEIAKNQLRHNLALAIMGNQFRLLQAAISERV